MQGNGRHHLGDAVAFGFAGKEIDQRPDDQPADGGDNDHIAFAQP